MDTNKKDYYTKAVYLQKWMPFTKQLRKLMRDNNVPVVLLSPLDTRDVDSLRCSVGYVHDHTGEFREKIIMVYNEKDDDEDEDIPF